MAREKLCVGIDIGASHVKLCQLRRHGRTYRLERMGQVALPKETIVNDTMMNSARVVQALRELVASEHVRQKDVALAVAGHNVIVKRLCLPQMNRAELQACIPWEAEQAIASDIGQMYLDAHIVREKVAQQGQMEVLLVAAKKKYVDQYTSVIAAAGLRPVVCDVDAFAVETLFKYNYASDEMPCVGLLNVGATKTTLHIVCGGVCTFTKDLTVGGNTFTAEIQRQLAISVEEAEVLKVGHRNPDAGEAQGGLRLKINAAVQTVADALCRDIQRCFDFYSATRADPTPRQILLSGGAARTSGLLHTLQERLGLQVNMLEVFRKIDTGLIAPQVIDSMGAAAAVAVGLALRYPGDA